jgi:hypothetical protein
MKDRNKNNAAPGSKTSLSLALGLGGAGLVVTVLGLFLISRGDITAAPILLVLAYLVLFPLALTRS